jgi:arylsulfatase A-like enzyme
VAGPGIRRDASLHPPVNVTDVAPTIARILGIPVPQQAQGRVLHEIFES